nr:unnamed protein product [Callosobruchus analis]
MALQWFMSLELKLDKNPTLRLEHVAFMKEYRDMNHMEECDDSLECNTDRSKYRVDFEILSNYRIIKRDVLSTICQKFDPLGVISCVIIVAKLMIQQMRIRKLEWDDELPNDLRDNWIQFREDLKWITELSIPWRTILSEYIRIEIHGFSDASEEAYAACVYIRCTFSTRVPISNLICAKSRVAPVKQISLPRLELCSAVLVANYLMGDLPKVRVNTYLPFQNAGTDYGGPFYVKDRRGRGARLNKMTTLPELDISQVSVNRLNTWQQLQAMTQHYWKRWSKEYLAELQTRTKWKRDGGRLLEVGFLVLLKEENTPTLDWRLGRVVRLFPGQDDIVRVCEIKVRGTIMKRAINKLYVLPVETHNNF